MTESPLVDIDLLTLVGFKVGRRNFNLRNILLMNLSLLTGLAFFFPNDRNINANDKPPIFVRISLLGEPMGDPLTLFKLKISNAITSRDGYTKVIY